MLPFIDDEPPRRHDTTVEITIDPGAKLGTVRTNLLERGAAYVGAAIGPASSDSLIVATVNVTLSIRLDGSQEAAHAILPISLRFDHGELTADWAPDRLLGAVIRNELERVWRRSGVDEFLSRLCAFGRAGSPGVEPMKHSISERWPDFEIVEPAFTRTNPSASGIFGTSA